MAKIVSTLRKAGPNAEKIVVLEGENKSSSLLTALGVILIIALIFGSFALVISAFNL